ncbi:hypothetical protein JNX00_20730 [Hydrogenophaga sp. YM1]|uniref:hypothetical protein n=1 Tax=Hydrogenophaga sp. YM1 TaxID=2806262 RepID=UPI00195ACFBD|nr:hypothetical protein [Hydrogenophaga sp. YM1]QRR34022.1 hypothetical protein JNX00_20730 [Hydrogenophaga sp. YM1]
MITKSPSELWSMSVRQFNEWRASNDIPVLLSRLSELLPEFEVWLTEQGMTVDLLCQVVPTSAIFKGLQDSQSIQSRGVMQKASETIVLTRVVDDKEVGGLLRAVDPDPSLRRGLFGKSTEDITSIVPYFTWLRKQRGGRVAIPFNKANRQVADSFRYSLWESYDVPESSRAWLFGEVQVLKLGGFRLTGRSGLGGRNLDFADLDWLTLDGVMTNSQFSVVTFSSVKHLKILNSELPFLGFDECAMEGTRYENCRVQDHYYRNIGAGRIIFRGCSVYRLGFHASSVLPMFEGSDIKAVTFEPDKKRGTYRANAETFRLLRIAAQSNGLRREASEFYYRERVELLKASWAPYKEESSRLKGYPGRLQDMVENFRIGRTNKVELKMLLKRYALFYVGLALPRSALAMLQVKLRWAAQVVEWGIWGFGERPVRILGVSISVIVGYACVYSFYPEAVHANWTNEPGWREYFYLSLASFTSLVFGDIGPKPGPLQLVCVSEALLGALAAGLLIAGFSNRARY